MKTINRGAQRAVASYKVKTLKERKIISENNQKVKSGWISQLRQAFSQETPEEWMPAQYQGIFHEGNQ